MVNWKEVDHVCQGVKGSQREGLKKSSTLVIHLFSVLGTRSLIQGRSKKLPQRRDVTSRGTHAEPVWVCISALWANVRGDHDEEPQYLRPDQTHHTIYLGN